MTLEIIDLHVEIDGVEIIKGVSLKFEPGEIHVLMGPNGSGKTTLANAVMGNPQYKITQGKIILDGKDITNERADVRAKKGLFLSFQHPSEVAGVQLTNFLRSALNNVKGRKYSVLEFHKLLREKMALLKMDNSFKNRSLNEGFSGGEKKRNEMLQLLVLEPKYALLDETDSGLDIDAMKIVAEGLRKVSKEMGIIVITHYNRFLEFLQPDKVSVLCNGKILRNGSSELAKQIEKEGFGNLVSVV